MQAIAIKELRSRMRGVRAFAVLTVYLLLLACLVIGVYWVTVNVTNEAQPGAPPPLGRILFYSVTLVELLLIAPLAPAFTAGAITGERERQTFDLVMTTPISAKAFVLGKMASSLSYSLLLIFAALPVQVLSILFGGLTITEVILGFWFLIVAAVFYGSASMFFSAVMRSTTAASIFSYLTVAMTLIGAIFIAIILGIIGANFLSGFAGGGGPSPSVPTIYVSLVLISLSPLLAGGVSAASLISDQGTFLISIPYPAPSTTPTGTTIFQPTSMIYVPSPWIIYSIIYIGLSALLLWFCVRSLRPALARRAPYDLQPAPAIEEPSGEDNDDERRA